MIHSLFIRLVVIAGLTAAWLHAQGGSVVDIGSRRELMVDRFLIERLQGTTLRLQTPQPGGIAVKYDRPWEDRFCFYTTVLKDGDKYLMYYRSYFGNVINQGAEATCYAESTDGIHWTKPDLGLVEFRAHARIT